MCTWAASQILPPQILYMTVGQKYVLAVWVSVRSCICWHDPGDVRVDDEVCTGVSLPPACEQAATETCLSPDGSLGS